MKKVCHSNTTRLFVSQDKYSDAYFIRTEKEKFARFVNRGNHWRIWFYPYKYNLKFNKLSDLLEVSERMYKKFWEEKHGESN